MVLNQYCNSIMTHDAFHQKEPVRAHRPPHVRRAYEYSLALQCLKNIKSTILNRFH